MEQEQHNLETEKEQLHTTTNEVITDSMSKMPTISKLTNLIVSTAQLELLGFAMEVVQEYSVGCRQKVSELRPFE